MSRASGGAATYQVMQLNTILTLGSTSGSTTTATHIRGGSQYTGSGLTVLASGNVGIGDTTPQALLDVGGGYGGNTTVATFAHATDAYIEIENMTSQNGAGIILTNAGTKKWTIQKDTSAHSLHIQDTSGDVMTFLQGGNVGIGTTPSGWAGGTLGLQIKNSGLYGYAQSGVNELGHTTNIYYDGGWKTISNDVGSLFYQSGENGFIFGTTPAASAGTGVSFNESMRIAADGKVGIGTGGAAGYDFELRTNDTSAEPAMVIRQLGTGDASIGFQTAGANNWTIGTDNSVSDNFMIAEGLDGADSKLVVSTGGFVGIGTTSPGHRLSVKSAGGGTWPIQCINSQNGNLVAGFYESSSGDGYNGMMYLNDGAGNNDVKLNTNGTSWMNGGNVGIGTTSPDHKLTVASGSIKIAETNSRLVFGTVGGTDRRAVEGSTDGATLQVGEGYTKVLTQARPVDYADSVYHFKISKQITCTGSATTTHTLDINALLGAATGGTLRYEVSIAGYGSGGSNGLNAKYSVAGYSGHSYSSINHGSYGAGTINNGYESSGPATQTHAGVAYHPCVNMGAYIVSGAVYAYVPAAQQYGFTVVNGHSTAMGAVLTVEGVYT
jgi:hypothetical protein